MAGCAKGGDGKVNRPPPLSACTGDARTILNIENGTDDPVLPRTRGQRMAIGKLSSSSGGCSGSLVAVDWVLTAKHCTEDKSKQPSDEVSGKSYRFCSGADGGTAQCQDIDRIVLHPTRKNDLALMHLSAPMSELLPNVQPLAISKEDAGVWNSDQGWKRLEAAGFGTGSSGRDFVYLAVWNVADNPDLITTWGENKHGVCNGDSGGPLMHLEADGIVRQAGVLFKSNVTPPGTSEQDLPCTLTDDFTRVDVGADDGFGLPSGEWIERVIGGPTGVWRSCVAPDELPKRLDGRPTGQISDLQRYGACASSQVLQQCNGQSVAETTCKDGKVCGWDGRAQRFACVAKGSEACGGVTRVGACQGRVVRWCEIDTTSRQPVLKQRDCASCERVCAYSSAVEGYDCMEATAKQATAPAEAPLTKNERYNRLQR